jgi:hypothetical protein
MHPESRSGHEPDSTTLEKVLFSELDFECHWFLAAWADLVGQVGKGDVAVEAAPLESNATTWSYIDRLLTHLQRIDRIINPTRGLDSKESYAKRLEFAAMLRTRISPDLFRRGTLETARNICEHANEYLPDFVQDHHSRNIDAFEIGGLSQRPRNQRTSGFRSYDVLTGDCLVMGRRVNLTAAERAVRKLKFELPGSFVHSRLTAADLPGPNEG